MTDKFGWFEKLTPEDLTLACDIIGGKRAPDLTIAPDGTAYIYRWHVVRTDKASVYFHIQVASDPARPLHDHPWDNTSVILSGGYNEVWHPRPWHNNTQETMRELRAGDVVHRLACEAHRLILPTGIPYTMSLFSCGPKVREWGFWYPDGWRSYKEVTRMTTDGRSVHIKPGDKDAE